MRQLTISQFWKITLLKVIKMRKYLFELGYGESVQLPELLSADLVLIVIIIIIVIILTVLVQ